MFTGIVEEKGKVQAIEKRAKSVRLKIKAQKIFSDLKHGDSVATNGVCLTVSELGQNYFVADVMNQTLENSTLGLLKAGSEVNLERALRLQDRLGGHVVSGHVDCMGTIVAIEEENIARWYYVTLANEHLRYIIEKGSVCLDGISLTVAKLGTDSFAVSTIPVTQQETILGTKKVGDKVNIELDLFAKYIERLMKPDLDKTKNEKLTLDFLTKNGFA